MTVQELIDALKKQNPSHQVEFLSGGASNTVEGVAHNEFDEDIVYLTGVDG